MEKQRCPRCDRELMDDAPLYQCCRCFTLYCKACEDSPEGRKCPLCKMGQRLIFSAKK